MKAGQVEIGGIIALILFATVVVPMLFAIISQMNMCQDTQRQLEQCRADFESCKSQLINMTECQEQVKVCYNLLTTQNTSYQECLSDLEYSQGTNQTITPSNLWNYKVSFNNITITLIQFITITVTPITLSFVLEVSLIKIKFREGLEKFFAFLKMFSSLISISVILSLVSDFPLILSIVISGVFSWVYVYRLKKRKTKNGNIEWEIKAE